MAKAKAKAKHDPAPIEAAWRRLEAYAVSIGGPPLALASGASEKAIAAAEKTMKLVFPPDFRASLLLHDGQTDARAFPWMPGCPPLAPLATIVELWKQQQARAETRKTVDPAAKLEPGVLRAGRIPIADGTFLDLDPGPAGVRGQLITKVTKRDLVVIDTGFAPALERWVSVLERGIWVYDPPTRTVHPRALAAATAHPAGLFSRRAGPG